VARGLLLFVVLAALVATPAAARVIDHNPVGVPDPTGDSNGAPDITRVSVANSNAGEVLFVVQVANRSDLVANDLVAISIDSDQNGQTGERNGDGGIDYVILIGGTERTIILLRWNGTQYEPAPMTSLQGAFDGGYAAIVNRAELGNTSAMSFFVETSLENGTDDQFDSAPNDVYRDYTLSSPHIQSITPRWAPAAPRAGGTFRLTAVQLKLESEETAAASTFTCRATLAGKRLRGTGRGGCTFKLARSAKGKRLVITITAAPAGGKAQTFRAYTFRVR
jgi:hypothetical protein